jgi:MFS family permease
VSELIPESEDRSEARLEREPEDQQLPPNIELIPSAEPETDTVSETDTNLRSALREIFSWRNYAIYLLTSWIFGAFDKLNYFFNLYLLEIGWEILFIGSVGSMISVVTLLSRFFGGYVGDVVDRKVLSTVGMLIAAIYSILIGLFVDTTILIFALVISSLLSIVKGGSTAYIMDNIPKKHSGLALSLFTAGGVFGVITLLTFHYLVTITEFAFAFRVLYLLGGIVFLGSTIARAVLLDSSKPQGREEGRPVWKDFIHQNINSIRLFISLAPGIVFIMVVDAISDSLFNFGAPIYTNEILGVRIIGINIIVLTALVVSVPLLLSVGRSSDKRNPKHVALMVYSLMPVCALLLILAPVFPVWGPASFIDAADAIFPGLGVIFTTPFLAIMIKTVNDSLWWLVILTVIRRSLPAQNTSKILAVYWIIVAIFRSVGPFLGGVMYVFLDPATIFIFVLVLNLIILGSLSSKRISITNDVAEEG